jgi:UDP-N-acetylglucosamine acyltransferase
VFVKIHPTAIVDPEAEIGEGVEIGPYAYVGPSVVLGKDCIVHSHAHIQGNTILGERNQIFPYALIGTPPQDKKYKGEDVYLYIGNDNVIREFVTMNPGTVAGGGKTVIGNRNLFMAYVHVAHDVHIGDDCVFANMVQFAGHVIVENRVNIGGMCGIHQFVRIGELAMIGGGSMVAKDVPPYCLVAGNRPAVLRGINRVGLERAGFSPEVILAIKEAYRILFRRGKLLPDAISEVEEEFKEFPEVLKMVHFLKHSERGVTRP